MSWACPHQRNHECTRLKKACQPLQKGCVLDGKAACIDSPLDRVKKNGTQKENKEEEQETAEGDVR